MRNKINIGILGGGQLARMSLMAAVRMGFEVSILEKQEGSPAGQLTDNEYTGWVDDKKILKNFIENCDVITLENEFIDYHYIEKIEKSGKKVIPSAKTISLIQDKYIQKETLRNKKIPAAKFMSVECDTKFEEVVKELGLPFLLKSRTMGYDGYGNATVYCDEDFKIAIEKLKTRKSKLFAEKFVNFSKELAIMVVRTEKEIATYPVVETVQKDHICKEVIAPADISPEIAEKAKYLAKKAIRAVDGIGLYGVEMFLTKEGAILINELAPRPHNSGHYTIEACYTSQFENHIRSVLGYPLGSTEMIKPAAVMINILGKREGEGFPENMDEVLKEKSVAIHIYGKKKSRVGRKMGHITAIGDKTEAILKKARKAEKIINI
jgi:5-(carboxyamino)imidazole ribonucleotide synthase